MKIAHVVFIIIIIIPYSTVLLIKGHTIRCK